MYLIAGTAVAILIILGFVGWGRLVSRAVYGRVKGDWPFHAAWGACLLAVLGGVLSLFAWVSPWVNVAVVVIGIGLALPHTDMALICARIEAARCEPLSIGLPLASLALVSVATFLVSLYPLVWEPNDDAAAYAVFPVKMLQSGTLIEPFSFRRIVGFGGYPYLQSLVLAFLPLDALHLLDRGIMAVLVGAALTCYARRRMDAPWPVACAAGLASLLVPLPRINLSANSVQSLFALAILDAVQQTSNAHGPRWWKRAALFGLLAAGLLALRANTLAIAGALLAFLVVMEAMGCGWLDAVRKKAALLAGVGVVCVALLVPWAIVLYESSGTVFFPFLKGNYNQAIPMSSKLPLPEYLAFVWNGIAYSKLHYLAVLSAVAALTRLASVAVSCFSAAALATALAMLTAFNWADSTALHRYYSPFTYPAFILTFTALATGVARHISRRMACKQHLTRRSPWLPWAAAAGVTMLIAGFAFAKGRFDWGRARDWRTVSIQRSLHGRIAADYSAARRLSGAYAAALGAIPRGSRLVAAVDAPYLLDYRNFSIFILDDIGVASPPPGLPVGGDVEDFVTYLTGLSIEYLLFVKPVLPLHDAMLGGYNREWWKQTIPRGDPNVKVRFPNYEWYFRIIAALPTRYPVLYDTDDGVLVQLTPGGRLSTP